MSGFPPQRPMGMPPMGPGMMPNYGYGPPMGMMPMGMGMMHPGPPMMRPGMNNGTSGPKPSRKLIPQEIPKSGEDKLPPTTVFVGNISDRAPDTMIRQMLQRCGNVLSWKRVQGASGKLQAFGFCEYEDPEATLRCMRLLNEWEIADRKLVVKVDAKTKTLLDEYKTKKAKKAEAKNEGKDVDPEEVDEMAQREDRVAKAGLDAIMREYDQDLKKEPPPERKRGPKLRPDNVTLSDPAEEKKKEKKEEKKKEKRDEPIRDQGLEDMGLEQDEKDLINREIHRFRDAHKDEEPEDQAAKERAAEARRRREELRELERREREMRARAREIRRPPEDRIGRNRMVSPPPRDRSDSRERSRERDRMSRDRDIDEDEDEANERRRMEKKMREKEFTYQERLKTWEARERKKAREYDKEKDKEEDRRSEEMREARRLREFLEDYVDDRDDLKYYKGSALQRRLKEREKEIEMDSRDRQREKEEIAEIRRRLEEEGNPNLEEEMAKFERERDEHLLPRMDSEEEMEEDDEEETSPEPAKPEPETFRPLEPKASPQENTVSNNNTASSSPDSDNEPAPVLAGDYITEDSNSTMQSLHQAAREEQKLVFSGLKLGGSDSPGSDSGPKRKKMTVGEAFNNDEEEEEEKVKRRKLVPLDYGEDGKSATGLTIPSKPTTAEEKRRMIKSLIERIPTGKEELFAFKLDWTMVDTVLMDKRIKPWVNKKIVEYIGEEEATLTQFICQKVMARTAPQQLLNEIAMVLDEEAEVFVVKMWRLLIYETEAKKLGLVK